MASVEITAKKKIRLKLAWGSQFNTLQWKKSPVWREVDAFVIDPIWAAHNQEEESDERDRRWVLTHRITGFAAARVKTFEEAKTLGLELTNLIGPKKWVFTDFSAAKKLPRVKEIKALVLKAEGQ